MSLSSTMRSRGHVSAANRWWRGAVLSAILIGLASPSVAQSIATLKGQRQSLFGGTARRSGGYMFCDPDQRRFP